MNKKRVAAIRALLEQHLSPPGPTTHMTTDERMDAAAEAIAALPANRPAVRPDDGKWHATCA